MLAFVLALGLASLNNYGKDRKRRTFIPNTDMNRLVVRRNGTVARPATQKRSLRKDWGGLMQAGALGIVRSPFLRREVVGTLVYQDRYQLATSSGVGAQQVFRANSIFDFDFTGTGHQPMYRDQIAAQYQFYKVLGLTIHWSMSTSNTNNGLVTLSAYNSSPPTAPTEAAEFARRPSLLLSQYQRLKGVTPVDIAAGLGLTSKDWRENSLYLTAVGSNPTLPLYVQFALDVATATDTGATLLIFAEFSVLFTTPVDPGLS
jgi:hypothetical protein